MAYTSEGSGVTDATRNVLDPFARQALNLLRGVKVQIVALTLSQFPILAMATRKDVADACEDERVMRAARHHLGVRELRGVVHKLWQSHNSLGLVTLRVASVSTPHFPSSHAQRRSAACSLSPGRALDLSVTDIVP